MKKFLIYLFLLICIPASLFGETKILFLGDSLTAGYGLSKENSYPYLIDQKLKEKGFKDVKIINGSISGSTSASSLSRLKWFLRIKPDILFLALGANDGLRGLPVKNMKKNLGDTVALAKNNGMKVILAGMKMPPNYGADYGRRFEEVYRDLAQIHKIILIPFLLDKVGGDARFNQADGIHPNREGQRIIAENVISYILELL